MTEFLQVLVTGLGLGCGVRAVRAGRRAHLPGIGHRQLRSGRARHARRRTSRSSSCSDKHELADRVSASPVGSSAAVLVAWRSSTSCCACSPRRHRSPGSSPPSGCSSSSSRPSSSSTAGRTTGASRSCPTTRSLGWGAGAGAGALHHRRHADGDASCCGRSSSTRRIGLAITASAAERAGGADAGLVAQQAVGDDLGRRAPASPASPACSSRPSPASRRSTFTLDRHRYGDGGRAPRRVPVVPADARRRHDRRRSARRWSPATGSTSRTSSVWATSPARTARSRSCSSCSCSWCAAGDCRCAATSPTVSRGSGTGRVNVPGSARRYRRDAACSDRSACSTTGGPRRPTSRSSRRSSYCRSSCSPATPGSSRSASGPWPGAGALIAGSFVLRGRLARGARHPARRAAHHPGWLALRAARAPDPRREPRRS